LATNPTPKEIVKLYQNLIGNNFDELLKLNKLAEQQHFVSKVILEFLKLLEKNLPNKLAFDYKGPMRNESDNMFRHLFCKDLATFKKLPNLSNPHCGLFPHP